MTRKELVKFHRLFNELVQKEVNGRLAYKVTFHEVDFCGGIEVIVHSDCLIWLNEIVTLQTICRLMCLNSYIELYGKRILIH